MGAGVSAHDLVATAAWWSAAHMGGRQVRGTTWVTSISRVVDWLAVSGGCGPAGLSMATNYLCVLMEWVATQGFDLAIAYDAKV